MTSLFDQRPEDLESTGMQWTAVESSQISEIGYESGAEYPLGIKFPPNNKQKAAGEPGSEYHYKNVSPELYAEFLAAESIGSCFAMRIKGRTDLYPYVKVEADPTPPASPTIIRDIFQALDDTPTPSTALAVIDTMADDLLFTPGAVTDAQLAAGREWYLTEAKRYDISTEKSRTELKRFARPLQKLRTSIEARAKELTGATKRKIAAIDAEKRRLVQIVGGIEDKVLAPLTSWENEEEQRKIRLSRIANDLAVKGQTVYASIAEIETAIAELESFDLSMMQEYKVGAESAIIASLKVLKPELERRKVAEANEAELAKLRAESAATAEADRLAEVVKEARELAEREAAQREARIAQEMELMKRRAEEAAAQAKRDQEQAVENERMRVAVEAKRAREAVEAREADEAHRIKVNYEAAGALVAECQIDEPAAYVIVEAIAKGIIPHVRIEY